MSNRLSQIGNGASIWLFDCRDLRRAAISDWLDSVFGRARVCARREVPTNSEAVTFFADLGPHWVIFLHVGNDFSLGFAETLKGYLGHGCLLVLFSGGDESNFDDFSAFESVPFTFLVCYVSQDWLEPLRDALADTSEKLEAPGEAGVTPLLAASGLDIETKLPEALRLFEVERAHVSHDVFTNGFCSPLGFHCTEADSPRRRDPLVWARADSKWWELLRGPASGWPATRQEVEGVFQAVERIGVEPSSMTALSEIIGNARVAMDTIDVVMKKLAGTVFEHAALTDAEIDTFWKATDVVRHALQAIRVTDRGLDPTFFGVFSRAE